MGIYYRDILLLKYMVPIIVANLFWRIFFILFRNVIYPPTFYINEMLDFCDLS